MLLITTDAYIFFQCFCSADNTAPFLVRPVSPVGVQHPSLYPAIKGVGVQRRVGGGPLTVRLSELGLTELQRLAALAGAQCSHEPRSKLDGRDLFTDAPVTLENRCPVALEFGQVRLAAYTFWPWWFLVVESRSIYALSTACSHHSAHVT